MALQVHVEFRCVLPDNLFVSLTQTHEPTSETSKFAGVLFNPVLQSCDEFSVLHGSSASDGEDADRAQRRKDDHGPWA